MGRQPQENSRNGKEVVNAGERCAFAIVLHTDTVPSNDRLNSHSRELNH